MWHNDHREGSLYSCEVKIDRFPSPVLNKFMSDMRGDISVMPSDASKTDAVMHPPEIQGI